MGNDAALAVLSDRPQLLYNYFKQLFAQVTNPPVDGIREEIIMSMETTIGAEGNLLEPTPRIGPADQAQDADPQERRAGQAAAARWLLACGRHRPLRPADSSRPRCRSSSRWTKARPAWSGPWTSCAAQASAAIADGNDFIILSDRGVDAEHAPIPALLAVAGVHHHLIRAGHADQGRPGARERRAARGASLRAADRLRGRRHQSLPGVRDARRHDPPGPCSTASITSKAVKNYVKAVNKGVVKVMSKMGISTAQSYCGAQIFEADRPRTRRSSTSISPGRPRASAASAST